MSETTSQMTGCYTQEGMSLQEQSRAYENVRSNKFSIMYKVETEQEVFVHQSEDENAIY